MNICLNICAIALITLQSLWLYRGFPFFGRKLVYSLPITKTYAVDDKKQLYVDVDYNIQHIIKNQTVYEMRNVTKFIDRNSLPDIDFRDKNWETVFMNNHFVPFFYNKSSPRPLKTPEDHQDRYTSIQNINNNGVVFTILYNACITVNKFQIEIYLGKNSVEEEPYNIFEKASGYASLREWKQVRYYQHMAIASSSYFSEDEYTWIMDIPHGENIAHFVEGTGPILDYIMKPYLYPEIHNIYTLRTCYGNDWRNQYMNILKSFVSNSSIDSIPLSSTSSSNYKIPSFYCQKDLEEMAAQHNNRVCFKRIYISASMRHYGFGGVFTSLKYSNYLRAAAYKLNNINISFSIPETLRVIIFQRVMKIAQNGKRKILNINQIETAFKQQSSSYSLLTISPENKSYKEQVQLMTNTDILIAVTGSGIANCLFQLPYSAVISLFPHNTKLGFFYRYASMSSIFYYPLYDYDQVVSKCPDFQSSDDGMPKNHMCWNYVMNTYIHSDLTVNVYELMNTVEVASYQVKTHKYLV
ncbi:hypothetical protein WA158_006471 [Blastocystis sp. Blastoise]